MIGSGNKKTESGPWAERNNVILSRVLIWDFVAAQCTEYGSLFQVTGPRWVKVRCPWNFFVLASEKCRCQQRNAINKFSHARRSKTASD